MHKSIFYFVLLFSCVGFSQIYEFHTIKDIETTPVLSQDQTGSCWSFATTSFLESEIIRLTGNTVDLSEMYSVRNTYIDKAENYVIRQGKTNFGQGGLGHDVINSIRNYGLVPQHEYIGKINLKAQYNHDKMNAKLEAIVKKAVAKTPANYSNWKEDYLSILDKYMGEFDKEKTLYPQQLLAFTKLNPDDYISLTSFTNSSFYSKFILNIPDNFANGTFYNLPLDEFIQNIDNALDRGYTLTLSTDISENTFSEDKGIAVIPGNEKDWKLIASEIKSEKEVSQEYRQSEFENHNTTDDHLMHIVGKVVDQKGNLYYKVKSSWGTNVGKKGFYYMSVSYLRLKAICVLLHKEGLTQKTKIALGV